MDVVSFGEDIRCLLVFPIHPLPIYITRQLPRRLRPPSCSSLACVTLAEVRPGCEPPFRLIPLLTRTEISPCLEQDLKALAGMVKVHQCKLCKTAGTLLCTTEAETYRLVQMLCPKFCDRSINSFDNLITPSVMGASAHQVDYEFANRKAWLAELGIHLVEYRCCQQYTLPCMENQLIVDYPWLQFQLHDLRNSLPTQPWLCTTCDCRITNPPVLCAREGLWRVFHSPLYIQSIRVHHFLYDLKLPADSWHRPDHESSWTRWTDMPFIALLVSEMEDLTRVAELMCRQQVSSQNLEEQISFVVDQVEWWACRL
jgi:hypothetical protein